MAAPSTVIAACVGLTWTVQAADMDFLAKRMGHGMRKHLPVVVMLLVGAGCPSEFGINGRIERAIATDRQADLGQKPPICPPGMHVRKVKLDCQDSPDRPCDRKCEND